MLDRIWEFFVRLRTWLLNGISVVIFALPDVLYVLAGADWEGIIPDHYARLFAIALALLNIWMRPRPAVMAKDPEAEINRRRKSEAVG